jgi:hypothetical protein
MPDTPFDDPRILQPDQRPNAAGQEDPALVYDNLSALQAQGRPGLHAFLVGVSGYPHLPPPAGQPVVGPLPPNQGLGMRQLSSTSLSALRVLEWLLQAEQQRRLHHPLATVRLLLSPTASERTAMPVIDDLAPPLARHVAFRQAARKWRQDASASQQAATLFYFAGHGLQRSRGDQVLLLQEFGDPNEALLADAVDLVRLRNGMAPAVGREQIARVQYYFVDACRNLPSQLTSFDTLQAPPVFDVTLNGLDDRCAPTFYAAVPDSKALAVPNDQTLFSKALLKCLEGGAGSPPSDEALTPLAAERWHITYRSLHDALVHFMDEMNAQLQADQELITDGFGRDTVFCYLNQVPQVPLRIEVDPQTAVSCTNLDVFSEDNPANALFQIGVGAAPHPYVRDVPAGSYRIRATVQPPTPPFQDRTKPCRALPPRALCRLRMQ